MPQSVQIAAPTSVLPQSLQVAFTSSRDWMVDSNSYAGGEYQRNVPLLYDPIGNTVFGINSSRKSWQLTKRLTADQWATLLSFWQSVTGCQHEFYYYDPYESTPPGFYDPTGASTNGRFIVRFNGNLTMALSMGRPAQVNISMLEVA